MRLHRRAQSIMEYLGVFVVFGTAGILVFAAANKQIVIEMRGTQETLGTNTIIDGIIGPNDSQPWPNGWNPDLNAVEMDENEVGYCQQFSEGDGCPE